MDMEIVMTKKMEMTTELRRVPQPQGAEAELAALDEEGYLKPERIQEWLKEWPEWRLTARSKMIHRVRTFPTREVAAHYSAFVTGLAGALALPVKVNISAGQVELFLYAARRRGRITPLTEAVLRFASQLG